jgi:hypothetical protein
MSQVAYRGNLSSAFFPFISRFQGRTVVVGGQDNNFNRQLQSSTDLDKDIGIPQLYYCHNVLPNGNGIQSVGYEIRVSGIGEVGQQQVWTIREDATSAKGYMMRGPSGLRVVTDENTGWGPVQTTYWDTSLGSFQPIPNGSITVAHVAGISYIYFANQGCLHYNFSLQRFELQPLSGLALGAIVGLTESNGYLIAYSTNAVAWSSTLVPSDFTPSLQTGAGGGQVEGIKGPITCASPTSNGFTIFTQVNAVSVLYTGNSRYPFQFSECTGSGGVGSLERVTYEADSGYNYIYSSKGFQIIQSKSAQTVFADVTDFLAGQYFEDFDEVTQQFTYQTLTSPLMKKMSLIASRYLIISYGISSLTHCLVYDTVQKRFGKLKVEHTDCFEYELLTEDVSDIPKKAIAFIQTNGTVLVVNFAVSFTNRSGVALLGKYQYVRSRTLYMQTVEFENVTQGGQFSVNCLTSYDGKNFNLNTPGTILESTADVSVYGFGAPGGVNHTLLVQGCFDMDTVQLAFNIGGRM